MTGCTLRMIFMIIKQSEIWLVDLKPTIGSEINKIRPCLVIGDDAIGKLPSKTVLPITGWSKKYEKIPWMIKCEPNVFNHLTKLSSIDAFQIRNLSTQRFMKRIGSIDEVLLFTVHEIVVKTLSLKYRLVMD